MGHVLSLMNEKGGVGKSTLTFSVAWHMAQTGKKVLMIDMDGQAANLTYMSGVNVPPRAVIMADVLLRGEDIREGILPVPDAPNGNLFLIPALPAMADTLAQAQVKAMKKAVASIRDDYDYIFFDVNPSPDWKHALVLSVCDAVCIVMMADVMSLEADRGVIESVEDTKENANHNLHVIGLVMNGYDPRTNLAKAVTDKVAEFSKAIDVEPGMPTVRKAVAIGESALAHVGITQYAPASAAADDIRTLTQEIERRLV